MTDDIKPSSPKTLTLKAKRSETSPKGMGKSSSSTSLSDIRGSRSGGGSVKTGARAHAVARLRVERSKTEPSPALTEAANTHRSDRPESRPARNDPRQSTTRDARPSNDRAPRQPNNRSGQSSGPNLQRVARHSPKHSDPISQTFKVFAPCPSGLEHMLEEELLELGFEDVQLGRAGCHFVADWSGVMRANLMSRIATRILARVGHGNVYTEDDIYALTQSIEWERWFGAERTLRVDTSAIRSPMKSLQFCNLVAKDGICDRLLDLEGERPSIDTVRPDARVHVFLDETTATLYLDTSGESLFKRGWRFDKGEAPLRENLAAGLLALAGWQPHMPLFDPFCGSGTILIEAAWISLNIPPGIHRPFAFERLRNHDSRRWQEMLDVARLNIKPALEAPIVGVDIDPQAIEAALSNANRSGLDPTCLDFIVGDAVSTPPPNEPGFIVTNPPYGDRLDTYDLSLWKEWAQQLKQQFSGWQLHVISSDRDLPKHLRLKPRLKTPVYNGALDCRLFAFDLVAASYRDPQAHNTR
jgi:putative N6-adenine-specific DNA methylase